MAGLLRACLPPFDEVTPFLAKDYLAQILHIKPIIETISLKLLRTVIIISRHNKACKGVRVGDLRPPPPWITLHLLVQQHCCSSSVRPTFNTPLKHNAWYISNTLRLFLGSAYVEHGVGAPTAIACEGTRAPE